MREYLFRGKRKDNGEWVYGSPIDKDYILQYIDLAESWTPCTSDQKVICRAFEIITETVGQYTGLKDKNGDKIFEGNIVLWDGRKAVIEWLPRMAGWYAVWKGEGVHFHDMQEIMPGHGGLRHIEIIGNTHDNPELVNPASKEGVLNTMIDPGTKQEETPGEVITAQPEQATEQESAEEGTTEG